MASLLLRRSVLPATRRIISSPPSTRPFCSSFTRYAAKKDDHSQVRTAQVSKQMKPFEEVTSEADLLPPGAAPGTVPTDLEQATGLERLEILGKMQGVDIFDMRPLDATRKGTLDNPIMVNSFGDEQYIGCTGCPVDSHVVVWLIASRDRPVTRCIECGSVYKMEYVGPEDDGHDHGHGNEHGHGIDHHPVYEEAKTMADYLRPEYR